MFKFSNFWFLKLSFNEIITFYKTNFNYLIIMGWSSAKTKIEEDMLNLKIKKGILKKRENYY